MKMNEIFEKIIKNRNDLYLLILRIFTAYLMFFYHGLGKVVGGPDRWKSLGGAMEVFGIDFFPTFWGFMAMLSESVGCLFILLGIFAVPSSLILSFTMFVVCVGDIVEGEFPEKPMLYILILFTFVIFGSGKYSLERYFLKK
tara:strand:- start:55912 stop:56337 length:426 start_codon:yes stop_codon:yes gene_type:complete